MFEVTYLLPSKILYTHCYDPEICTKTEETFSDIAKHRKIGTVFPKLQVVKKDGHYFTLNDAKLQVYRHLEQLGQCGTVEVEKVPLKEVPEGIRRLMKPPDWIRRKNENRKCRRKGKYESITTVNTDAVDVTEMEHIAVSKMFTNCEEGSEEEDESYEIDSEEDTCSDSNTDSISDTYADSSQDAKSDNNDNEETSCEKDSFI